MINTIGATKRVGTSTVQIALSPLAYPQSDYRFLLQVTTSGSITGGIVTGAQAKWSTDNGAHWTPPADIVLVNGNLIISTDLIFAVSDGTLVDDTTYEYQHLKDALALTKLYDDVVADLALRQPLVQQTFGWREPAKQLIQGARIDWVPGSLDGGMGSDMPARFVGKPPARNVADLDETFTVYLKGHDPTQARDERAQYTLVRYLYAAWRAAFYRAAHGNALISGLEWNIDKNEFRLGAQVIATCSLRSPIPDDLSIEVGPLHFRLTAILAATAGQTTEIAP